MSQVIGKILMLPRGVYDATATYNMLDVVRYNGKVWCCKANSVINVAPSESASWTMLVQDGADGAGTGDMTKARYDTDDDGIVDAAETIDGLTASITQLNYLSNVTSDVQTQLNGKQASLTFDDNPTSGSNNPVKSGGVYNAVGVKIDNPAIKTTGQVLTYNGTAWVADDKEKYLVQQHTLDTTATTCTFTNALITTTSTIDVYVDDGTSTYVSSSAITYDSITVTSGECAIAFPAQDAQSTIGVKIFIR